MTNFDAITKFYSKRFASVLKDRGITRSVYRGAFGTGFASRMFFFENVAPVEQVRTQVRKQMLLDEYAESLTPVEAVFIENYNNIASFLNLPLYEKDIFLQRVKEQQNYSYYNSRFFFINNRAEFFAPNSHITALVKEKDAFKYASNDFERITKSYACDIITKILYEADRSESFWA